MVIILSRPVYLSYHWKEGLKLSVQAHPMWWCHDKTAPEIAYLLVLLLLPTLVIYTQIPQHSSKNCFAQFGVGIEASRSCFIVVTTANPDILQRRW